jgi:uncharacterized membrane protein
MELTRTQAILIAVIVFLNYVSHGSHGSSNVFSFFTHHAPVAGILIFLIFTAAPLWLTIGVGVYLALHFHALYRTKVAIAALKKKIKAHESTIKKLKSRVGRAVAYTATGSPARSVSSTGSKKSSTKSVVVITPRRRR